MCAQKSFAVLYTREQFSPELRLHSAHAGRGFFDRVNCDGLLLASETVVVRQEQHAMAFLRKKCKVRCLELTLSISMHTSFALTSLL